MNESGLNSALLNGAPLGYVQRVIISASARAVGTARYRIAVRLGYAFETYASASASIVARALRRSPAERLAQASTSVDWTRLARAPTTVPASARVLARGEVIPREFVGAGAVDATAQALGTAGSRLNGRISVHLAARASVGANGGIVPREYIRDVKFAFVRGLISVTGTLLARSPLAATGRASAVAEESSPNKMSVPAGVIARSVALVDPSYGQAYLAQINVNSTAAVVATPTPYTIHHGEVAATAQAALQLDPSYGQLYLAQIGASARAESTIDPSFGLAYLAQIGASARAESTIDPSFGLAYLAQIGASARAESTVDPSYGQLYLAGVASSPRAQVVATPAIGTRHLMHVDVVSRADIEVDPSYGRLYLAQIGATPRAMVSAAPAIGTRYLMQAGFTARARAEQRVSIGTLFLAEIAGVAEASATLEWRTYRILPFDEYAPDERSMWVGQDKRNVTVM